MNFDLPKPTEPTAFEIAVRALINEQSRENESDTPDYILAAFLNDCLLAFEVATAHRHLSQESSK